MGIETTPVEVDTSSASVIEIETLPASMEIETSPVKLETSPVKVETSPVKFNTSPFKIKKVQVMVKRLSHKAEIAPKKAGTSSFKVKQLQAKIKDLPIKETISDEVPMEVDKNEVHTVVPEVDPPVKLVQTPKVNEDFNFSFGFITPDDFGCKIIERLVKLGLNVCAYIPMNNEKERITGAKLQQSPVNVFANSQIIFSYAPDTKSIIQQWKTSFQHVRHLKKIPLGLVSMTSKDVDGAISTQREFNDFGVKYLEAKIYGSLMKDAQHLLIVAAGDAALFDSLIEHFGSAFKMKFLGNVENLSKLNMVTQTYNAITVAGLGSSVELAKKAGIPLEKLSNIVASTSLRSDLIMDSMKCEL